MLAVAATAMSASAQEPKTGFNANKFFDNWYIGINAGVATKTTHQALLKNLNPNAGLRVGKWLTPSVGLALEGNVYFGDKARGNSLTTCTFVRTTEVNLLGTLNFMNMFGGYTGVPRSFEIIGLAGMGWGHNFGHFNEDAYANEPNLRASYNNMLNSKLGLDFAFNVGKNKEWQIYVEPSLTYGLSGVSTKEHVGYDINKSHVQLNVGVNYYFKTSNGTNHFLNVTECDQRIIDDLNNQVNALRDRNAADEAKIAQLQAEIARLQQALRDCENKPVEKCDDKAVLPSVFYNCNKTLITKQQAENVAVAAQVLKNHPELKLNVKGYASPEGNSKHNDKLAVRRANAVKDLLVKKYGIDESRITTEGCGATKEMFETYENNRVAMMFIEK